LKRCILHLGMPKTASTSIQTALLENRKLLKSYGWEYPVFTCPQHGHTFFPHNDPLCRLFMPGHLFHVQRPVKNGTIDLEIQQKGLQRALDGYCQKASKLILSSEVLLYPLPLKRIADYMGDRGYDIEPIIYVRTPFSYRVSIYQSLLKFSQAPQSVFVKRLQTPLVKSAIEAAVGVFGNSVKFYPFNYFVKSNIDLVKHFLSHLLDDDVCNGIHIVKENKSPSWQATSLLEFIEENNPLYVKEIKSDKRSEGDIKPLYRLEGEKFRFNLELAGLFKDVTDLENIWLKENLGEEFCDNDYMKQVSITPMVWKENSIGSLLDILPELPIGIQHLTLQYFEDEAIFNPSDFKKDAIRGIRKNIGKKRFSAKVSRLKDLLPAGTKRGKIIRNLVKYL